MQMDQMNIMKLIEAGRELEATAMLMDGVHLVAATGPRSAKAALDAATRLFGGDLMSTILFMNRRHYWLEGETTIERAEKSDEDLEFITDKITAIDYGVFI